jgi:hypothetical protein
MYYIRAQRRNRKLAETKHVQTDKVEENAPPPGASPEPMRDLFVPPSTPEERRLVLADMRAGSNANDATTGADRINPAVHAAFEKNSVAELKKLYADAVPDVNRQNAFEKRMSLIKDTDPQLFEALKNVGERMATNPPPTPEKMGQMLGTALSNAWGGSEVDYKDPAKQAVLAAVSGMMLAERGKWMPGNDLTNAAPEAARADQEKTRAMVDGVERAMNPDPNNASIMVLRNGNVEGAHAVIYGKGEDGYGEPALGLFSNTNAVPPQNRYDFHVGQPT